MIKLHPEILTKDGKPQFAVLPYDEFLIVERELAKQQVAPSPDPRFGEFRDNLSAEELARRQGVKPLKSLKDLAWPYGPEDWEGFDEAVVQWRREAGFRGERKRD